MTERVKGFRSFSDEAVKKRTGRTTAEWNSLLDEWGAPEKRHTLAARYLASEHGLTPW